MVGAWDPSNFLQQAEEAVALQAIFEEDFRVLCVEVMPSGIELDPVPLDPEALLAAPPPTEPVSILAELLVHVQLPEGGLQLLLDAPGAASLAAGEPVSFLPPLRLLLHLPPGYPAAQPPSPQLRASWLAPDQAASLEQQLLRQWEHEAQGGPVCWLWSDWLKCSALQHLGIIRELTVHAQEVLQPDERDPTGVVGCSGEGGPALHVPAEEVAVSLMRYAASRSLEAFRQKAWSCPICLEDVLGAACVRLPDCRHVFCAPCFTTHCRLLAAEGAVENIRCPDTSCRLQVPPHVLRGLLSEEEFARWEALMLQRALDRMSDVCYCPRCRAPCIEEDDHMSQCAGCLYVFCGACSTAWHPGEPCLDAAQVLEMRMSRAAKAKLSYEDRLRMEVDIQNQVKSALFVQETTKPCPVCGMAIDKFDGCNKVHCSNCDSKFCWACKEVIQDYSHFTADGCRVFDDAAVAQWNAQQQRRPNVVAPRALEVEQRRLVANIMLGGQLGHARPAYCPLCGQMNVKTQGNNNVRCWSCNNNFCALCREHLKKPGSHFGPRGCRQHSFD